MKQINTIYAVRNKDTGEFINKGRGNPLFISKYQAEQCKKYNTYPYYDKTKKRNIELVTFELKEVNHE